MYVFFFFLYHFAGTRSSRHGRRLGPGRCRRSVALPRDEHLLYTTRCRRSSRDRRCRRSPRCRAPSASSVPDAAGAAPLSRDERRRGRPRRSAAREAVGAQSCCRATSTSFTPHAVGARRAAARRAPTDAVSAAALPRAERLLSPRRRRPAPPRCRGTSAGAGGRADIVRIQQMRRIPGGAPSEVF